MRQRSPTQVQACHLWTNYLPIPNGYNVGSAVDKVGNVFVTGSGGTVKYSNTGVPLWTNGFSTGLIALDSAGNVFVSDYFYTVAFSNSGLPLWTNRYVGPTGSDGAFAMTVDSGGNVLLTGSSENSGPFDTDYATIKYSNGGVLLWTNRYNGPGNSQDYAGAIAVDSSDNVFVTGGSAGLDATIKYSHTGVPLWTNRYNGGGASAIAVDTMGNAFVTGASATIKYSGAAALLWVKPTSGYGISVDSAGNVFVTGTSSSGVSATIAYSNSGVLLWTRRFNARGNSQDQAFANVVDSRGNVIVAGHSWNGSNYDSVTIKYSSSVPPPRLDFQLLNNQLVLNWTNAAFHQRAHRPVTILPADREIEGHTKSSLSLFPCCKKSRNRSK